VRALLDINVLIALLDSQHIHHRLAVAWLDEHIDHGWASCPLTQNGVIRIMSQPAYPNPLPAAQVAARLSEAAETSWHCFWPDTISLLDGKTLKWDAVLGSRQITDCYLLALAVHHHGRLVTFDRKITHRAVPSAGDRHLAVIE
jgi:uncharacterized protein